VNNGIIKTVRFNYHVRPLDFNLDYDWIKLEKDLKARNLLQVYKNGRTQISGVRIDDLIDYWIERLNIDPLYFLDDQTKISVSKKLEELGTKFELKHFE
jgi:hypothetical protein